MKNKSSVLNDVYAQFKRPVKLKFLNSRKFRTRNDKLTPGTQTGVYWRSRREGREKGLEAVFHLNLRKEQRDTFF